MSKAGPNANIAIQLSHNVNYLESPIWIFCFFFYCLLLSSHGFRKTRDFLNNLHAILGLSCPSLDPLEIMVARLLIVAFGELISVWSDHLFSILSTICAAFLTNAACNYFWSCMIAHPHWNLHVFKTHLLDMFVLEAPYSLAYNLASLTTVL